MGKAKRTGKGSMRAPTTLSGFTAVLENIYEQNRVVLEAVQAVERRLTVKMDDLERRLTLRIEALEIAVRKNSEDIRKNSEDIRKNSEDIRKNSEDIKKNSEDIKKNSEDIAELQRRVDALSVAIKEKPGADELRQLEVRVSRIEAQLGIEPIA